MPFAIGLVVYCARKKGEGKKLRYDLINSLEVEINDLTELFSADVAGLDMQPDTSIYYALLSSGNMRHFPVDLQHRFRSLYGAIERQQAGLVKARLQQISEDLANFKRKNDVSSRLYRMIGIFP